MAILQQDGDAQISTNISPCPFLFPLSSNQLMLRNIQPHDQRLHKVSNHGATQPVIVKCGDRVRLPWVFG
ncbi:hypothetical protein EAF00_008489 [Botryotinia globosa]|nr:hypothetical protein EAF00_008489 [Botryotinia globosa]